MSIQKNILGTLSYTPWRGLVLPLAIVVVWELIFRAKLANPVFLPSVFAVIHQGHTLIANGEVWVGLKASLIRNFTGLAIGASLGIGVGILLGVSRLSGKLFLPTLDALKQISPFALIPLLSFWFGLHEPAKIAFIALTCVFPILTNTYEGVRNVALEYVEVGRAYTLSPLQTLRLVVLPAAAPSILRGLHLGVFFSWLGTVGAEYFFAAGAGVGNIILDGRNSSRMDLVLFGVFVIGFTGFLLNALIDKIEKRVLHWRTQESK